VKREFVSRVPGQVCRAELEAEIGQPMRDVISISTAAMIFPAPPAAPQTGQQSQPPAAPTRPAILEVKRTAVVDQPLRVDFIYSINPDCSSVGAANIRTIEEPSGKLTITNGSGFSNFAQDNPRQACNRRRSEGMLIYHRSESGYLGPIP
jgi:hypothetical protein